MIEDIELGPIEFILFECDYWVGLYLFGLDLGLVYFWVEFELDFLLGLVKFV